jgi:hypothetical protein
MLRGSEAAGAGKHDCLMVQVIEPKRLTPGHQALGTRLFEFPERLLPAVRIKDVLSNLAERRLRRMNIRVVSVRG